MSNQPTYADLMADMRARLTPSAQQRTVAAAMLAADPHAEHVMVGVALPNKTRGLWFMDQEVHAAYGFWLASDTPGDGSYSHGRDAAELAARTWLHERQQPGVSAYAVINRDGTWAVFEGF